MRICLLIHSVIASLLCSGCLALPAIGSLAAMGGGAAALGGMGAAAGTAGAVTTVGSTAAAGSALTASTLTVPVMTGAAVTGVAASSTAGTGSLLGKPARGGGFQQSAGNGRAVQSGPGYRQSAGPGGASQSGPGYSQRAGPGYASQTTPFGSQSVDARPALAVAAVGATALVAASGSQQSARSEETSCYVRKPGASKLVKCPNDGSQKDCTC